MPDNPLVGYERPYAFLKRFEALIESILCLRATVQQLGFVRFKPLFSIYNSIVDGFKEQYRVEYDSLGLEDVPLYGETGNEHFNSGKLSTVLHHSQAIVGSLKGMLPPALLENPGGTTIIATAQAASRAESSASADIHFSLLLDGFGEAIQQSQMDPEAKAELLAELDQLRNASDPGDSRLGSFAKKLGTKLREVTENVAIAVLTNLLQTQFRGVG